MPSLCGWRLLLMGLLHLRNYISRQMSPINYECTVMKTSSTSRETHHRCHAYDLDCYTVLAVWPHFYQTRSAWSMDQGSTKKRSVVHNFVPTILSLVTKLCVMWEETVNRRVIFIWSLIHGSSWSGLIKVGPGDSTAGSRVWDITS